MRTFLTRWIPASALALIPFASAHASAQLAPAREVRPLYRHYSSAIVDHFYSAGFAEVGCGLGTYAYESVPGYILPAQYPGSVPLRRFWSQSATDHFYTTNPSEFPAGYVLEGVMGYVFSMQVPGTVPLWRWYDGREGLEDHIYTANPAEVLANTYTFEGIVGYIYPEPPGSAVPCRTTLTVDSPQDGAILHLDNADLTGTTFSLAGSAPGAWLNWYLNTTYRTSGNRGPFIEYRDASTVGYGVRGDEEYVGIGGQINVRALCAEGPALCDSTRTVTIAGAQVPKAAVTETLTSLYASGATPRLLTGIAMKESSYRQFSKRTLNGVTDLWPVESPDGGSHIGLMQMPVAMDTAWNWKVNTTKSAALFREKLAKARTHEDAIRANYSGLRELTPVEREHMAVLLYGPAATSNLAKQYYIPGCMAGKGTSCSGGKWDWIVNKAGNKTGVSYVDLVWSYIQ